MVMPYMNGGELFFHLSEGDDVFGEERTKFYAAEITLALGYMHDNGILYRDLKVHPLFPPLSFFFEQNLEHVARHPFELGRSGS